MTLSALATLRSATLSWLALPEPRLSDAQHQLDQAHRLREQWENVSAEERLELPTLIVHCVVQGGRVAINFLDRLALVLARAIDLGEARPRALDDVRWAVAQGFNPNRYNGVVTPVGLAGYTGQVDLLELFQELGADLCLELIPEHARECGAEDLAGTTLLHRLALRSHVCKGSAPVMAYLARHVPGSLHPDACGRTALTDPDVRPFAKTIIEAALAPSLESLTRAPSA